MLRHWFGLDAKWRRVARRVEDNPLGYYYSAPLVDKRLPLEEIECVSMDFETTGLDIRRDHIISIGMVTINRMSISVGSAWRQLISTSQAIPEHSAIVHRITDDMAAKGRAVEDVLPQLLEKLRGRVLIAHHARVELGFLNELTTRIYGYPVIIPVIDTLQLAKRHLTRSHQVIQEGMLRLSSLRQQFHLPEYRTHDALSDALATAELFLILANRLYPNGARLKDVRTNQVGF